jgi:hypothetical protein
MEFKFPRNFLAEEMTRALDVSQRESNMDNFEETYPLFSEWYGHHVSGERNSSPKEVQRFRVFKELIVNIHEGLVRKKYEVTVASYKCLFEQFMILLTKVIVKKLDCMTAYEFFRGNLLKFTLDDGWINKRHFNKNDVEIIFLVVYDCFLFKIEYYKFALAKKKCLDLVCVEAFELPISIIEPLNTCEMVNSNEIAELQQYFENGLSVTKLDESELKGSDMEKILNGEAEFPIVTKKDLMDQHLQRLKQEKIDRIMEREMAKLTAEFNAKPLTVSK